MKKILDEFLELAAFGVPSMHEAKIREVLRQKLDDLGFETSVDNAFPENHSGNLYGTLKGNLELEPLLFAAHMDTVSPCERKHITLEGDGTLHTDGTTILGSDDISGIVEFLEAIRMLKDSGVPHRTIEVVFTASEEYFVEGAKRLDYSRIQSKEAYILDTDGEIGRAVIAAPTGIRITSDIYGKSSHAALKPEDGVNAIQIASRAVSRMKLGRVSPRTTANIGIIHGGNSGNIVPDRCFVEGETRSLSHEEALEQAEHMRSCFADSAKELGGQADTAVSIVYNAWRVQPEDRISQRFAEACADAGLTVSFESACGGSDASFISAHGIRCLVVATGMHEIHSVREYTTVGEMETMSKVVYHLMTSDI